MSKIKNIIIFLVIAAVFAGIYIYFIKPEPEEESLVSVSPAGSRSSEGEEGDADILGENAEVANEFLTLLLSVKSIKLDDAIFSDQAFMSLRDSSIELIPDGNEGRPNPFAPIGAEGSTVNTPPTTPSGGVPGSTPAPGTPGGAPASGSSTAPGSGTPAGSGGINTSTGPSPTTGGSAGSPGARP